MLMFIIGIFFLIVGAVVVKTALSSRIDENIIPIFVGSALVLLGLLVAVSTMVVIVDPGNVGVVTTLGSLANEQLNPGIHLMNPLSTVTLFSIRTESIDQTEDVLTSDGLTITQDYTVLYHVSSDNVSTLYRDSGENFKEKILLKVVNSAVRDVTSKYTVQGCYNDTTRGSISGEIKTEIIPEFNRRGVVVESVLMRKPKLPTEIETAIKSKLQAEQMIQQKDYEVQTAMKNAEIKRQEARGIADANIIIANSLSSSYLQWEWLQRVTDKDTFYVATGESGFPVNLVKPIDGENAS